MWCRFSGRFSNRWFLSWFNTQIKSTNPKKDPTKIWELVNDFRFFFPAQICRIEKSLTWAAVG